MPIAYSLTNPGTDRIYYVGFTTKGLNARLLGHITEQAHPTTKTLIEGGILPLINIIEEGDTVTLATETYYIRKYVSEGHPLENVKCVTNYQAEIRNAHNKEEQLLKHMFATTDTETGLKFAFERILNQLPRSAAIPIIARIKNIAETALSLSEPAEVADC